MIHPKDDIHVDDLSIQLTLAFGDETIAKAEPADDGGSSVAELDESGEPEKKTRFLTRRVP